jgi:hypothetical protein
MNATLLFGFLRTEGPASGQSKLVLTGGKGYTVLTVTLFPIRNDSL